MPILLECDSNMHGRFLPKRHHQLHRRHRTRRRHSGKIQLTGHCGYEQPSVLARIPALIQ